MAGIGLIETRSGKALPTGLYDLTRYDGLDNANAQNGITDVTTILNSAIAYCRDNDLTPVQPHSTTFGVTDTVRGIDVTVNGQGTATAGNQTSVGVPAYVGEQGGTKPEIKLLSTATGFSNPSSRKVLMHFLKMMPTTAYPPPTAADEQSNLTTFFGYSIDNIKLNGNGFPGCDLLLADGAQAGYIANVTLDGSAGDGGAVCHTGLTGMPGRGMSTRNVRIINCYNGVNTQHTLFGYSTSLGSNIVGLIITGCRNVGIITNAQRGALSIHGLQIQMSSGAAYAIQAIGDVTGNGSIDIFDSIIDMTDTGSTAIYADDTEVIIHNSYFKNSLYIIDNNNSTDYSGFSNGVFYVERYNNAPAKIGTTGTTGSSAYYIRNGVAETTPDASANNAIVAALPSDSLDTKYINVEPWCMDSSKVIIATDVTSTAAVVPNADTSGITDNTTTLQAKIDEAIAAGKWLYLPKGWYKTSAPISLRATGKLLGQPRFASVISPLTSWITAQNTLGAQSALLVTDNSITGDAGAMYVALDASPVSGARCGLIDGVWNRNSMGRWIHLNMQQGFGYFRKKIVCMRVIGPNNDDVGPWGSGNGGGFICSVRNDASIVAGEVSNTLFLSEGRYGNRLRVNGVTKPLLIIGYNPEWGGSSERVDGHAPMIVVANSTNVRLAGIKTECAEESVQVINSTASITHVAQHRGYVSATLPTLDTGPVMTVDSASNIEAYHIHTSSTSIPGNTTTVIVNDASIPTIYQVNSTYNTVNTIGQYTKGTLLPNSTWDLVFASSASASDILSFSGLLAKSRNISGVRRIHKDVEFFNKRVTKQTGRSLPPNQLHALNRLVRKLSKGGVWSGVQCLQLWLGDYTQSVLKIAPNLATVVDDVYHGFTSSQFNKEIGFTISVGDGSQWISSGIQLSTYPCGLGVGINAFPYTSDTGVKALIGSNISNAGSRVYFDTTTANRKFTGQNIVTNAGAAATTIQYTSPVNDLIVACLRRSINNNIIMVSSDHAAVGATTITPVTPTGVITVFGQCNSVTPTISTGTVPEAGTSLNCYFLLNQDWTSLQLYDFLQELKLTLKELGRL